MPHWVWGGNGVWSVTGLSWLNIDRNIMYICITDLNSGLTDVWLVMTEYCHTYKRCSLLVRYVKIQHISNGYSFIGGVPYFPISHSSEHRFHFISECMHVVLCKAKRQHLLTLQVRRYCLLVLHSRSSKHWWHEGRMLPDNTDICRVRVSGVHRTCSRCLLSLTSDVYTLLVDISS